MFMFFTQYNEETDEYEINLPEHIPSEEEIKSNKEYDERFDQDEYDEHQREIAAIAKANRELNL